VRAVSAAAPYAASSATGRSLLVFWLLLALVWFLPLNSPHLFDPDEGRYAEIPREMLASGDWVTPRLDGIKYFEKPALQYWATACAYALFGQHAWTVRLWPALTGFLGLLMTWALGRRLYDERSALLAVLVQASALLYLGMARIATLDMSLSCTLQLAMTALVIGVSRPQGRSDWNWPAWGWPVCLGVGVALAVLTKGLIGILIPGAVATLFMLIHRDWRLALRAQPWWALLAVLLIAGPWLWLASRRNPEFAHFFFVVQHFQRYLNRQGFDRYQPAWFFVPVLVAGFLPWTTLLPGAVAQGLARARGGDRGSSMLLIWSAFVLAFFSLSQSKLMPYIVPMFPALSLLTGRALTQLPARRLATHLLAVTVFAGVIVLGALVLWVTPLGAALMARATPASIAGFILAFAVLGVGAGIGAYRAYRGQVLSAVVVTACGSLLLGECGLLAADQLPRMQRVVDLAEHLQPVLTATTHVYCVGDYVQPIPYYLKRPCTLVGYRGELDFGLSQEPWRFIGDLNGFATAWQQESDALAILRPDDYQRLESLGAPMRVIYTAPSYVAVVRQ
jgi:4-amino-4-deoxy-L-arabinose transferase-like glycosyltransferase